MEPQVGEFSGLGLLQLDKKLIVRHNSSEHMQILQPVTKLHESAERDILHHVGRDSQLGDVAAALKKPFHPASCELFTSRQINGLHLAARPCPFNHYLVGYPDALVEVEHAGGRERALRGESSQNHVLVDLDTGSDARHQQITGLDCKATVRQASEYNVVAQRLRFHVADELMCRFPCHCPVVRAGHQLHPSKVLLE